MNQAIESTIPANSRQYFQSPPPRMTLQSLSGFILLIFMVSNVFAAPAPLPAAPTVAATSYILQDFNSGRIITEQDADKSVEPASLTKLMTAYVVFNELESGSFALSDTVLISEKAWRTEGSRMFVEVNTRVPVEELIKGMIIQSGNDASVSLAEHVAGTEDAFAQLMNHYAQLLGMSGTHFVNSTGLPDPQHFTTARDLAILARAVIRDFPEYYKWYSTREFTYNKITQYNRNKLLWRDKYVDGIKTGHTESAGFCLISSALQDDMRLITVVLGTKSEEARAQESQKLLNFGFRFFETHQLYTANSSLTTSRIWKGESDELPLGLAEDLYVTIPRGRYDKLNAMMNIEKTITAPVAKGAQHGTVEVTLEGDVIAERPLIALREIAEGGFLQRITDEIGLFFQ